MSSRSVRVSGKCKAGHPTTRDADLDVYGRPLLTWRGQCPVEGCEEKLIARRVKKPAVAPATTEPSPPPPAATIQPPAGPPATQRHVRKVTSYRDEPQRPPAARRAKVQPASVPPADTAPIPAVAPPEPVVEPAEPGPAEPGHAPRRARRHRFSLGSAADARDNDGFIIPNIY